MSGNIVLTSTLGQGTTVTVSLPYDENLQPPVAFLSEQQAKDSDMPSLKILVVDDHPINRKLAQIIFESLGQQTTFAESGEEAIKKTKANHYDAIFMDIHMPGISGIEASEQIRGFNKNIPIVALTADVFEIQKQGENHFSFSQYLSKPIDKTKLRAVLLELASSFSPTNKA